MFLFAVCLWQSSLHFPSFFPPCSIQTGLAHPAALQFL